MAPGTNLAMPTRTLLAGLAASLRFCSTAPSENTLKFRVLGVPAVKVATPAACTTVNEADELLAASFEAVAAAALIVSATVGGVGVTGGGAGVSVLN